MPVLKFKPKQQSRLQQMETERLLAAIAEISKQIAGKCSDMKQQIQKAKSA